MNLILSAETEQEAGQPDRAARTPDGERFEVHLDNFDGPFDLLLHLISRHKLDITEVALSQVTDEFIAYIKAAGEGPNQPIHGGCRHIAGSQGCSAAPVR